MPKQASSGAQDAIEKALRARPTIDPDREGGIPYRYVIPAVARDILVMRRPNALRTERKNAKRELERIASMAKRLADRLEAEFSQGIPLPEKPGMQAVALLQTKGVVQAYNLCSSLKGFVLTAKTASERYAEPPRVGRAPKSEVLEIGLRLYEEFERLTGKKPTRTVRDGKGSGQFQTLVERVFKALGISASAESTVVRVMVEMKKAKLD